MVDPFCFAFIWFRVEVAASLLFFYWGDVRKWHLSNQLILQYEGRNRLTCVV